MYCLDSSLQKTAFRFSDFLAKLQMTFQFLKQIIICICTWCLVQKIVNYHSLTDILITPLIPSLLHLSIHLPAHQESVLSTDNTDSFYLGLTSNKPGIETQQILMSKFDGVD